MSLVGTLLVILFVSSSVTSVMGSIQSVVPTTEDPNKNPESKLKPKPTSSPLATGSSRQHRLNSRFLRTFPSFNVYSGNSNSLSSRHPLNSHVNNLNFGRREPDTFNDLPVPLGMPMGMAMSMGMGPVGNELVNGNSPVFYIRLPPAPYILVPGLGYVSPHPYNSPMAMGMPSPVMGAGGGGGSYSVKQGIQGAGSGSNSNGDLSPEQSQKSVISLPLKFLSNGSPYQIESPKKPSKSQESKGSTLISGGKYSFNGKPTAVFVVRSPAPASSVPAKLPN